MIDMRLNGLNVVVSSFIPLAPRVSLSEDFSVASEGCIRDMNDWLREMFGTKEGLMLVGPNTLVVGPKTYAEFNRAY